MHVLELAFALASVTVPVNYHLSGTLEVTPLVAQPNWCKADVLPRTGDRWSVDLYLPEVDHGSGQGSAAVTLGPLGTTGPSVMTRDAEGRHIVLPLPDFASEFHLDLDQKAGSIAFAYSAGIGPIEIPPVTLRDCQFHLTIDSFNTRVIGDSTGDRRFTSEDLVRVLQAGQYEDQESWNSTWDTGDWNADREFGSGDLIAAFQSGGYERPPRNVYVPEPNSLTLMLAGCLSWRRRARHRKQTRPRIDQA